MNNDYSPDGEGHAMKSATFLVYVDRKYAAWFRGLLDLLGCIRHFQRGKDVTE